MSVSADARLRVLSSIGEIERREWDECANPGWPSAQPFGSDPGAFLKARADAPDGRAPYNPFVSYDFLKALEDSGSANARSGWAARHLVLDDEHGGVAGVVPCYQKPHSMGEYVFDHGWADAFERAGGSYYPKLQVSIPFTPATGPRLLVKPTSGAHGRAALTAGLTELARRLGTSSVHATFVTEEDAALLEGAGFLLRLDQQFHFENEHYRDFEDFLDALASRKRKAIRRERREALEGGLTIRHLTGSDITERAWDAFFRFYTDTGERKWGRPYLNRRFFSMIGERMADRILLIFAERDGVPIAGALNFIGSDTLYGRYWGTTEEVPFLHFEVCYHQAVDFAIAHRLPHVEAGAQGEHKLARGYRPVVTRSAHWIADRSFRRAVANYLEHERAAVVESHDILDAQSPFKAGSADE